MDEIKEMIKQFKELGLSNEQILGYLKQALKAGEILQDDYDLVEEILSEI